MNAFDLYGTSEGILKGWETRRRGGAGLRDTPVGRSLAKGLLDPTHGEQLIYQNAETGEWHARAEGATVRKLMPGDPDYDPNYPRRANYKNGVDVVVASVPRLSDDQLDGSVVKALDESTILGRETITIADGEGAAAEIQEAILGPRPASLKGTTIRADADPTNDPPGVIHTIHAGGAGKIELVRSADVHPDYMSIEKFDTKTPGKGTGQALLVAAADYAKWLGLKGLASYPTERTESATRVWDALKRKGRITTRVEDGDRVGRERGPVEYLDADGVTSLAGHPESPFHLYGTTVGILKGWETRRAGKGADSGPATIAEGAGTRDRTKTNPVKIGAAIDKLLAKHGPSWVSELVKIHKAGKIADLLDGDLDDELGLKPQPTPDNIDDFMLTYRDKLLAFQVALSGVEDASVQLRIDPALLTRRASAARGAAALSKLSVVQDGAGPPSIRSADVFGKPAVAIRVPLNLKTTMNGRQPVTLVGLEPSQDTIPVAGVRKYLVTPRRDPPDVMHAAMRDGRERWVIQEGHTRAAAARLRGEDTMDARVWEFTENAAGELVPVPRGLQKRGMAKAFLLYGTSEGILKGWETRRRGGGSEPDKPKGEGWHDLPVVPMPQGFYAPKDLKHAEVFFHGTVDQNLESIKKHGLISKGAKGAEDWLATIPGGEARVKEFQIGDRPKSVYVTLEPWAALDFAEKAQAVNPGSQPVVLVVRIPRKYVKKHAVSDEFSSIAMRFPGTIKPEWIRVMNTKDGTLRKLAADRDDDHVTIYLSFLVDADEPDLALTDRGTAINLYGTTIGILKGWETRRMGKATDSGSGGGGKGETPPTLMGHGTANPDSARLEAEASKAFDALDKMVDAAVANIDFDELKVEKWKSLTPSQQTEAKAAWVKERLKETEGTFAQTPQGEEAGEQFIRDALSGSGDKLVGMMGDHAKLKEALAAHNIDLDDIKWTHQTSWSLAPQLDSDAFNAMTDRDGKPLSHDALKALDKAWYQAARSVADTEEARLRGSIGHASAIKDAARMAVADEWSAKSDLDRLEAAKNHVDLSIAPGAPSQWKADSENTSDVDYLKTKAIARQLVNERTANLLAERGLVDDAAGAKSDTLSSEIPKALWRQWKNSSTSPLGNALQIVVAEELGTLKTPDDPTGARGISPEERKEARAEAVLSFTTAEERQRHLPSLTTAEINRVGGLPYDDYLTWREAQKERVEQGGAKLEEIAMNRAKAYARAQWETTQFILKKSGTEHVEVLRAIILNDDQLVGQTDVADDVKAHPLPALKLLQNAAASTTTRPSVANNWQGVGNRLDPTRNSRVVIRIRAPRTSVLSMPVFGDNVKEESEVVVIGTNDLKWDAHRHTAPDPKTDPIKLAADKPDEKPPLFPTIVDLRRNPTEHWLKGGKAQSKRNEQIERERLERTPKKLTYREELAAFQLYGTSEGIIKGWETRRRGGAGADDETHVGITSARPGIPSRQVKRDMHAFADELHKVKGVTDVSVEFGHGIFMGSAEPTWVVKYKGNGEARKLLAKTALKHDQDAVLMMKPGKTDVAVDLTFDREVSNGRRANIQQELTKQGLAGGTWFKKDGKTTLRMASVQAWGGDKAAHVAQTDALHARLGQIGIKAQVTKRDIATEVIERADYASIIEGETETHLRGDDDGETTRAGHDEHDGRRIAGVLRGRGRGGNRVHAHSSLPAGPTGLAGSGGRGGGDVRAEADDPGAAADGGAGAGPGYGRGPGVASYRDHLAAWSAAHWTEGRDE